MKTFGHKFKIYFPSFIYSKVTKMCFEIKNFREGVNPKKKKSLLYFESILFASKITVLHIYHFKFFLDLLQLRRHLKERKGTPQGFAGKFEQGLIWQKKKNLSRSVLSISLEPIASPTAGTYLLFNSKPYRNCAEYVIPFYITVLIVFKSKSLGYLTKIKIVKKWLYSFCLLKMYTKFLDSMLVVNYFTGSNYPKQYFQTEAKNETIDSDTYF